MDTVFLQCFFFVCFDFEKVSHLIGVSGEVFSYIHCHRRALACFNDFLFP